jgi:nucleotide-binding universal stress UspA family protein
LWYDAGGDLERLRQELARRAERLTARVVEELRGSGLAAEAVVRDGDPRATIVDEAEAWAADLIVVGSHGYTGLKRWLLGSVAQSVVSHAPCSVEIVRHKAGGPEAGRG